MTTVEISQVFGSRGLLIAVLAFYLLMRGVDLRLGRNPDARDMPLVSAWWSVPLLGFGVFSLYDGASGGDAVEVALGVLLIAACIDQLIRWRLRRSEGA